MIYKLYHTNIKHITCMIYIYQLIPYYELIDNYFDIIITKIDILKAVIYTIN